MKNLTTLELRAERDNLYSELVSNGSNIRYGDGETAYKALKRNYNKIVKELTKRAGVPVQGTVMTADEFNDLLGFKGLSEKPYEKFKKKTNLSEDKLEILNDILKYEQGAYNYFNKNFGPENIRKVEISKEVEKVESSNIYDKMGATTYTTYNMQFDIHLFPIGIITVERTVTKNTTLSQADIRAFM